MPTFGELESAEGEGFLSHAWPWKPFVSHGSLARLPEVLRSEQLRLEYLLTVYAEDAWVSDRHRPGVALYIPATQARAHYNHGAAVALHRITKYVSGLPGLEAALSAELGVKAGSVSTSLFAAPIGSGLPQHFDGTDNIMIQLQGRKQVIISEIPGFAMAQGEAYNPTEPPPHEMYAMAVEGFPPPDNVPLRTVDMEPGTVVYMPRGTWHATTAITDSVGLSIGMRQPMILELVLAQLRLLLLQDARWRRPWYESAQVPAGTGAAPGIEEMLTDLPRLVQALDGDLISQPARPPTLAPAPIGWQTAFHLIPTVTIELQPPVDPAGDWSIRLGGSSAGSNGRPYEAPVVAPVVPFCQWLAAQHSAFAAADLTGLFPDIPRDFIMDMLRGLVDLGVIRPLWFPLVRQAPEAVLPCTPVADGARH